MLQNALQKACLLLGLAAAAAVLSGCTPAVQSEEATSGVRAWSNVTTATGADVVDVEVSPSVTAPRRVVVPANVTAAPPRAARPAETAKQRISRLEARFRRVQKEAARVRQELERARKQADGD